MGHSEIRQAPTQIPPRLLIMEFRTKNAFLYDYFQHVCISFYQKMYVLFEKYLRLWGQKQPPWTTKRGRGHHLKIKHYIKSNHLIMYLKKLYNFYHGELTRIDHLHCQPQMEVDQPSFHTWGHQEPTNQRWLHNLILARSKKKTLIWKIKSHPIT